jgi:hypothetical protein
MLSMLILLVACATASGPVELLDATSVEAVECRGAAACLTAANQAIQRQEIGEAAGAYRSACANGSLEGCHALGSMLLSGVGGPEDRKTGRKLMKWACSEGSGVACHDAELAMFDRERAGGTRSVFEHLCNGGVPVACTNLANLYATGRGGERDHDRAGVLFRQECARRPSEHPLAQVLADGDYDLVPSMAYSAEVACEQLGVLARGLYEERLIAAIDAEWQDLQDCYSAALSESGGAEIGRITLEAEVSEDGGGGRPVVREDTLGLDAVHTCVERAMTRHLDDGETGPFQSRWGFSFVAAPPDDERPIGCNPVEVRAVVSGKVEDLRHCGAAHFEEHPDDPGAVLVILEFARTGVLRDVMLRTTTQKPGLDQCLRRVLEGIELTPFADGACPISIPLVISGGRDLHFLILSQ